MATTTVLDIHGMDTVLDIHGSAATAAGAGVAVAGVLVTGIKHWC